jgi:L-iditol 2-dehydrogenase
MRVAELLGVRQFRLSDIPQPEPGPGEIRVRVGAVGLCGSDLHNYSEGSVGDMPCVYPMVVGHEPAGTVDKCGNGVTGWAPGDRAIFEPALYCYHCEFCLSGRHNICANLRFLSSTEDPGFLRDYVILPAHNVLPMPAHLSMDEGTVAEPLAVVLHSMKFAAIQPGETVVVFGAGPIGLLTIASLRMSGAGRIWVFEPVARRREIALQMGATAVFDPHQVDPVAEIARETGKRGVDVAIDCAAKEGTINLCLRVTRNGGRVVYTAIPSEASVSFDFHVARRKELALYNVRRSNHETETAIQLLAEHPEAFRPMLTHALPLEQVDRAFRILEKYDDGAAKIIIRL